METRYGLSAAALKYLAALCMLLDHMAVVFPGLFAGLFARFPRVEKQAVFVYRFVIAQPAGRVEGNGALEYNPLSTNVPLAGIGKAFLQIRVLDELAGFFVISFHCFHLVNVALP